MDQKRLIMAIAISIAILLGFQLLVGPHLPKPPQTAQTRTAEIEKSTPTAEPGVPGAPGGVSAPAASQAAPPKEVPRVKINAPSVQGSVSLVGARLDDVVLLGYRETLAPDSPLVRLFAPRSDPKPYYAQWGWTAEPGNTVKVPDVDTEWTASAPELTAAHPVTLSWNNGAGLTFQIVLSVDENYMFTVEQHVQNTTGAPVALHPWARIRREYKPDVAGYYVLFEGLLGVVNGTLQESTYANTISEAKKNEGVAFTATSPGGWAGITDKYWLAALVPDQSLTSTLNFRHNDTGPSGEDFQVDYVTQDAKSVAPGGDAAMTTRLFAGAKIVRLLDTYQQRYGIPSFDKAVDFGWFYFLTKPIFFALDWLNSVLGNFGLAIMAFTVFVKALFFPLANYSYRSMSKMKLLAPKMTALRERYKEDPAKLQQEMMGLYRAEKVNPASGCLPMVVQIPVFFSLYKVIFVTIEMRHAPFFGWIHDLSAIDPTNIFNLFGLIPFDPSTISPFLHMGIWPLIMGGTMYLQQKMNPAPPDPVQAKMFQFMPIVFTFMMARFPAGLIIYWSWNNILSVGQQWLIQRRTRLAKPSLART